MEPWGSDRGDVVLIGPEALQTTNCDVTAVIQLSSGA